MTQTQYLVVACASLAVLTFVVGLRALYMRVQEMRARKIHPQSVALSGQRAERLQDSRASDNYNHLFELPVLFYALCIVAIAADHVPTGLPLLAWVFVLLRLIHSVIQCTYNKVMHRFTVFLAGFFLLALTWIYFLVSYLIA